MGGFLGILDFSFLAFKKQQFICIFLFQFLFHSIQEWNGNSSQKLNGENMNIADTFHV